MKKFVMNSLGAIREIMEDEEFTMRDYFAAKALDFSLRDVGLVSVAEAEEIKEAVNLAYAISDAMLEARK